MKAILALCLVLSVLSKTPKSKNVSKLVENFNENWEFKFASEYEWKPLDLPHDFSIIQPFDEFCEGESGFLPGGEASYRKYFTIEGSAGESKVMVYFYGSYKDTYVYINGEKVGENHYGYNSFGFDITNYVYFGQQNEILVTVTNTIPSSRWYSGSGIFRDVELIITGMVHVDLDGLKITTPDIASGSGTVKFEAEILNEYAFGTAVKANVNIVDKEGSVVATTTTDLVSVEAYSKAILPGTLSVSNPSLWSDTEPNLYNFKLDLLNEYGETIDNYDQKFGFRYYSFDYSGFHLNGKSVKLNGVSNHHDHGAIGSVDNYDAVVRKFKQLKDMGMNSIRTTHNIAAKNWIRAADEIGILIVEELFDGWYYSKNGNIYDFSEYFSVKIAEDNHIYGKEPDMNWYEFCVKSVVRRDRNNPSVIMWSLGNELASGSMIDEYYPTYCQTMIDVGKKHDTTRPFTSGDNNSYKILPDYYYTLVAETIHNNGGIEGFNYIEQEDLQIQAQKWGSVYISESASAINSRGIYKIFHNGYEGYDDGKYHLTSYDTSWVPWGYTAHRGLWYSITNDFCSGQYVWTGHDYIGEPTPWNGYVPGSVSGEGPLPNSAYFGIIDTAGFPKDSYYLYRAQQNHNSYTVHLVTAWDSNNIYYADEWSGATPVFVYSNAQIVNIFRSDLDHPICFMTRRKIVTDAGIEYYRFTGTASDPNYCSVVDNPDDLGSDMYGRFNIVFSQGTKLYAVAYDESGSQIPEDQISGNYFRQEPNINTLRIDAKVDREVMPANGHSLAYVELSIVDDNNNLDTVADTLLYFSLTGEGKILGVDNGDQGTIEKFQQKSVLFDSKNAAIRCFSGKALVIISSTKNAGNIQLSISSDYLAGTSVNIRTE